MNSETGCKVSPLFARRVRTDQLHVKTPPAHLGHQGHLFNHRNPHGRARLKLTSTSLQSLFRVVDSAQVPVTGASLKRYAFVCDVHGNDFETESEIKAPFIGCSPTSG